MAWVRRELDSIGVPPLKRFGQHFLIDRAVRERLIELADLTAADTVLEVGPGLGFLTSELIGRAGRTIAIEKDRALAKYLTEKFSDKKSLTVIQGDALTAKIPDGAKIVSSPPYNISSKLVLLIMNSHFQLAALLMQEEFVKRLTATNGSRAYGRISVMLQSRAQAEFDRQVSPEAFYPKPRISSAIVTIRPTKPKTSVENEALFVEMVRTLFTQRRRKLRGVLTRYLKGRFPTESSVILQRVPIVDKRVYEFSPDELMVLSNHIADAVSELVGD